MLRFCEIIDGTITAMDLPTAQFLLGYVVTHRMAHHRRAGHEQLGDVAHHDGEMAEYGLRGPNAHHAAEQQIDVQPGTVLSCATYMLLPRWPGRNEPPSPDTRGRPATIPPELSLALLSPDFCCLGTIEATLPPPDEPSSKHIDGHRRSVDSRSRWALFAPIAPSEWPPREVKSSAQTTTVLPSILPQPPTWLAGVKPVTRPSSS